MRNLVELSLSRELLCGVMGFISKGGHYNWFNK
jgi:hypothetical protein